MKNVTELKSLGDIRTAASHHIAAKPPVKGTAYLDLYLLDREKQRWERELSHLGVRAKRIQDRLGEIREAMDKLNETAQQGKAPQGPASPATSVRPSPPIPQSTGGQWKRMPVEY